MQLPFTAAQFFGVFAAYNEAVWPVQVFLLLLGVVAVALAVWPRPGAGVAIAAILAVLWLWLGVAYHLVFFTAINPLAYVFAAVSVAGALPLLWHGVVRGRLVFRVSASGRGIAGLLLIVFALLIYPLWSLYAGHRYPALPTFGLPCPTTIFTIGMLAFLKPPYPRGPLVVPILWCLIGVQAAVLLGVPQDLGLAAAGAVGLFLLARPRG